MSNGHLLFESIFERKLSSDDTRAYLEKITEEYPYFSPAQFFHLLNTAPDAPSYQQLAARTNVLFNNAYWLQFQLQEEREVSEQTQASIDEPLAQIASPTTTDAEPVTDLIDIEPVSEIPLKTLTEPVAVEAISPVEDSATVTVPEETNVAVEAIASVEDSAAVTVPEGTNIDSPSLHAVPLADPIPESVEIEDVVVAKVDGPAHPDDSFSSPAGTEELPVEKAETSPEENHDSIRPSREDESEAVDAPHSLHFNNQSTPLVNETEKEEDISAEQETAPLHFKLNLETPATTEDTITFEPLHTSDYFASQGIKLSNEVKPNDKLGKQLKSFTEWLKTMKKVHNDQLPPLSGKADQSIQKLAEQSNKDDTVLTEAMADVLLKQGKAEKAIEVYTKLSLLNPSKSTYFAAKIDQLKEH